METDRSNICGCKGIRTCLKCEQLFNITTKKQVLDKENSNPYFYCYKCNLCWPGWESQKHSNHSGEPLSVSGIYLQPDFLTEKEECNLLDSLESLPWDPSQSGRRKQNFGPKCNFKKRKLRLSNFHGFPETTKFIQERFKRVNVLKDFYTIEQCSLEYDPNRGASIDPHIDDCWVWGERVVTVNLLSDTILSLIEYKGNKMRYNLNFAPEYTRSRLDVIDIIIRIPMIRRSLFVMTDDARYGWEHQIFREDIIERRVCLAYREFTPSYLSGGDYEHEGHDILSAAKQFW